MNLWGRFKSCIGREIKNDTESQKVAIILRWTCVIMCIYLTCMLSAYIVAGELYPSVMVVSAFIGYLVVFYLTYRSSLQPVNFLFHGITLAWIVAFIVYFGWLCGVQHFLFFLVILNFLVSYISMNKKIVYAGFLCVLRLGLYSYTLLHNPISADAGLLGAFFQYVNTITIFILVTVAAGAFSKESQEMEKRLFIYNKKIMKLASVDPLTGLWNRRSMVQYIEKLIKEYEEGNGNIFSISIGDIDFFKKVNDTYGHDCGDVILKQMTHIFEAYMEDKGSIARWGGEEFLFVFPRCNGDDAYMFLQEISKKIRGMRIEYEGKTVSITMTFGLTEFDITEGVDGTIREADKKLYQGKETGRNRIVY